MEVTNVTEFYTNDVDNPRGLISYDAGDVRYYRHGRWNPDVSALDKIRNGGDYDEIPESAVEAIIRAIDKADGITEKAHNDRASPPIIEEDREATEAQATAAVQSALDKLQAQLATEMPSHAGNG